MGLQQLFKLSETVALR